MDIEVVKISDGQMPRFLIFKSKSRGKLDSSDLCEFREHLLSEVLEPIELAVSHPLSTLKLSRWSDTFSVLSLVATPTVSRDITHPISSPGTSWDAMIRVKNDQLTVSKTILALEAISSKDSLSCVRPLVDIFRLT